MDLKPLVQLARMICSTMCSNRNKSGGRRFTISVIRINKKFTDFNSRQAIVGCPAQHESSKDESSPPFLRLLHPGGASISVTARVLALLLVTPQNIEKQSAEDATTVYAWSVCSLRYQHKS